jgi:RND family efflux transporter MFP subunit
MVCSRRSSTLNPEIDLTSFTRQSPHIGGERPLVAPPRRFLTRYALPISLFSAFVGLGAYSTRNALLPAVPVSVVQPVIIATANEAPVGEAASSTKGDQKSDTPAKSAGAPLFQAPGWVEPDPFTTMISALVPGTISRVHVREGETVTSGQVVAELDDGDALVAVRKAEANLAVRQAELDAAQANWENPISLDETVKMARAEKVRLEAEKTKLQRQSDFSKKLASVSQTLGLRGADSALDAEKAGVQAQVSQAELGEIEAKILSQEATLEAAERRSKLRLEDKSRLALAKAQVEEAAAAVAEARLRLSRCKVVAPASGTIMRVQAAPGFMVSMDVQNGSNLVSMYDPMQMQVRAEVPQSEAAKIQVGLPAEIRVEAMPDRVYHGELSRIVHEADVQRNTLPVKVRLLDPDPTLKPEMVVRLQFLTRAGSQEPSTASGNANSTESHPNVVQTFVPAAVLAGKQSGAATLWIVGPDSRAHQKQVTVGTAQRNGLREIQQGLQPTDKIITSNTDKLREGTRVRITEVEEKKG